MNPIEQIHFYVEFYTEQIQTIEKLLPNFLPGELHIRRNGNVWQCVLHYENHKREYIHVRNRPIARELALKAYFRAELQDLRFQLDICLTALQTAENHPHAVQKLLEHPQMAMLWEEACDLLRTNGTFFTENEWMVMIEGRSDRQFRALAGREYQEIADRERNRLAKIRMQEDGKGEQQTDKKNNAGQKISEILTQTQALPADYVKQLFFGHQPDSRAIQISLFMSQRSDDAEIRLFLTGSYKSNPYRPEDLMYMTMDGEKMRSKLEVRTAELLKQMGIPYRYEQLLMVGDHMFYPDFILMHPRTHQLFVLEIFGKMSDPGYAANAGEKMKAYLSNGYIPNQNLLVYCETREHPLDFLQMKRDLEYLMA